MPLKPCVNRQVGHLNKDDAVLAVFPDTTSFYKGRISRPVKGRGIGAEITVVFDDDEDEQGRTQHRRIGARFVMADPDETYDDQEYFDEDEY